jgi:hypothetical protein
MNTSSWTMYDHGVNNAMGTKSCAVWYRHSGNSSDAQGSYLKLAMQDRYHGQPHGMFAADECFGGRALNRGIELCAVVEQMYSLGIMFQIQGDVRFLDRLEAIAFNSWPGTVTPDMWQHQYLQQSNEINALYDTTPHVWQTDGAQATGFGVAPNFGCCTANMQQGWPKYASNVFMVDQNGSVTVALLAPASAEIFDHHVIVDTNYPFASNVTVTVEAGASAITLRVRIPGWAVNATATLDGKAIVVHNGTFVSMALNPDQHVFQLELNPSVSFDDGWGLAEYALTTINYTANGECCTSTCSL